MRALILLAVVLATGCESTGGGSRVYEVDTGNYGTGEPVVKPVNDTTHWDGVPLDARTR